MDPQSNLRISYDILNFIIDQLGSEHCYNELKAFSQTCQMLLHPCRVYLFSTINLYDLNSTAQFAALLEENCKIAGYVQELTCRVFTMSEDLANALLQLNNLQTLKLYGCNWKSLSPRMQLALTQLFSSPSVSSLFVQGFCLPASLLSGCPSLKHLALGAFHSIFPEACDNTLTSPPQLLSLDLSNLFADATEGIYNMRRANGLLILDLSNLQSFISSVHHDEQEKHLENILRLTPKLNSLEFSVFYALAPNSWVQKLAIVLPTLHSLKLRWDAFPTPTNLSFPDLIKALEELACLPNCIDQLCLVLLRSWCFNDELLALDWELLDKVLADRSGFPRLKKFTIELCAGSESTKAEDQAIYETLKITKFPRLCLATNVYLDFKFEVA